MNIFDNWILLANVLVNFQLNCYENLKEIFF